MDLTYPNSIDRAYVVRPNGAVKNKRNAAGLGYSAIVNISIEQPTNVKPKSKASVKLLRRRRTVSPSYKLDGKNSLVTACNPPVECI